MYDAGKLLAVGIIAWQIFRGDYDRLIRRLTLAFAAVVVLAPMIQSWYVVWLIPLFAVTGIRDDWQVKALYFIVSVLYGVRDFGPAGSVPYLQTADLGLALALARNAAAIIALLFALYLIFLDPRPSCSSASPRNRSPPARLHLSFRRAGGRAGSAPRRAAPRGRTQSGSVAA